MVGLRYLTRDQYRNNSSYHLQGWHRTIQRQTNTELTSLFSNQTNSVLLCLTLPYVMLRYLIIRYLASRHFMLHYLALCYLTLQYLTLPCLMLPCLALPNLSYLVLPYFTWFDFSLLSSKFETKCNLYQINLLTASAADTGRDILVVTYFSFFFLLIFSSVCVCVCSFVVIFCFSFLTKQWSKYRALVAGR